MYCVYGQCDRHSLFASMYLALSVEVKVFLLLYHVIWSAHRLEHDLYTS